MSNKKDANVSTRTTQEVKDIIKNNGYTYSEALEYFAYHVIKTNKKDTIRLNNLKQQKKETQDQQLRLDDEILEIQSNMGYSEFDGIILTDEAKQNVQTTLEYFKREGYKYKSIDNFLDNAQKNDKNFVDSMVYLSGLNKEEFNKIVINEYKQSIE